MTKHDRFEIIRSLVTHLNYLEDTISKNPLYTREYAYDLMQRNISITKDLVNRLIEGG
jgi:hypothetical protein